LVKSFLVKSYVDSWCNQLMIKKIVVFSYVYMVIFDPQPMTSTEVVDAIWLRTISIACRYYICINQIQYYVDECDEWLKAWPVIM
jgi:hypothetical protein